MKRMVLVFLVCGMGAVSLGELLPDFTKLVVLKGTATDTIRYAYSNPDWETDGALLGALEIAGLATAAKPKVYYFLVVRVQYTPQITNSVWSREGNIRVEPMGGVVYGVGQQDRNLVWQPKSTYACGGSNLLSIPTWDSWSPKPRTRIGRTWLQSDLESDESDDSRWRGRYRFEGQGVLELVYNAKLVKSSTTGESWYEPSITSITVSYTQETTRLRYYSGSSSAYWEPVQYGAGKVVFKPDAKLTAMANLTDAYGRNIGLDQVATAIQVYLEKAKYPSVTPDLDPYGYYP